MAQIPVNVGDKEYDPLFKYGFFGKLLISWQGYLGSVLGPKDL